MQLKNVKYPPRPLLDDPPNSEKKEKKIFTAAGFPVSNKPKPQPVQAVAPKAFGIFTCNTTIVKELIFSCINARSFPIKTLWPLYFSWR